MPNTQRQPEFEAYSVIKRERQDDYWMSLGAAFPHADGKGYNIVLQATPLDGKIVLRPAKARSAQEHPERAAAQRPISPRHR